MQIECHNVKGTTSIMQREQYTNRNTHASRLLCAVKLEQNEFFAFGRFVLVRVTCVREE